MDFLVIDDEKTIRDAACYLIEDEGHYAEGTSNSADGLLRLKEANFDAVLLDMNLGKENGLEILPILQKQFPQLPVIMFTAQGSVKTAVEAMRLGAVDFLEKPFQREQFLIVLGRVNRLKQMGRRIEQLETQVKEAKSQSPEPIYDVVSPAMQKVMKTLERAAPTPATILILGESGTGKSMVAKAVHEKSHLAEKPFVTVSCPSLSKELLQSELFGHVKGSFTGAVKDHWGKVKAAEGGTLFLDEIGELPMEIQPKLLRLLQEREYERVGETVTRNAELRIIAATNRDLKAAVAAGEFREDLYYRLNVIAVTMPPLRERPQDIVHFAESYRAFFAKHARNQATQFSPAAQTQLMAYRWPGNLRELRNVIERAVILCAGKEIGPDELPGGSGASDDEERDLDESFSVGNLISLEKLETAHIRKVLERTSNLQEATRVLGIDQATLYRKRKKMGLD
jgi:two-component system, NtrC family, response regulator AlgB